METNWFKKTMSIWVCMFVLLNWQFGISMDDPVKGRIESFAFNTAPDQYQELSYNSGFAANAGLTCNTVTAFLDLNGEGAIKLNEALGFIPGNPGDYLLTIKNRGKNEVSCSDAGKALVYSLRNMVTQETCYGWAYVKDNLPPVIMDCDPVNIHCQDDLPSIKPTVVDNCDGTDLYYEFVDDKQINPDCQRYEVIVSRTWTITDKSGNVAQCTQTINISRPNIFEIDFPEDVVLECPEANTHPDQTGAPTLNGKPFNHLCGVLVTHKDQVMHNCGNTIAIWRTWTLTDCCNFLVREYTQAIHILDRTPPVIMCEEEITIGTDHRSIYATYIIPGPKLIDDACHGDEATVDAIINDKIISSKGKKVKLKKGEHTIKYIVTDPCGNSSECITKIKVIDTDPPTVECKNITVTVTPDTPVTLCIEDFDLFAEDNCGKVFLEVKKDKDPCGPSFTDDLVYDSCVTFCCEDDQYVYVTVRATDMAGNTRTCRLKVKVENADSGDPMLTIDPAEKEISCSDPLVFDEPSVNNICSEIELTCDTILNTLNECGVGMIIKRWIATNLEDNSKDTATQKITVVNDKPFSADNIICPADRTIQGCSIDDIGSLEDIQLVGLDTLSCYIIDTVFREATTSSPEFCIILTRTWIITDRCQPGIQWICTQVINVNDMTPPVLSGPSDTTIYVDERCLAELSLDSVVAMDCDPNVIITNSYGGGAKVDTVLTVGMHQVEFYGEDICGNRDTLPIKITVLDTIPPSIICLDSTINCGDPIPVINVQASDNCLLDRIELISDTSITDDCGTGQIIRIYRAYDQAGNSAECTATITIVGSGLFTENEINWPPSPVVFNDCNDPNTVVAPGTTVDTAGIPCIDVHVFSEDSIGSDDEFCYIIFRTWTVIDSCNFDEMTGAGKWDSVQIIAINDTTAPVLTGPSDVTIAADPVTCSAVVELDSVFATDCDPNVTVTNNKGGGPKFMGELPMGVDTIIFSATDSCGNTGTYEVIVTVKDQTAPVLSGPGDTTIYVGMNCTARLDLDSVIAEDCDPNVVITNTYGSGAKVDTTLEAGTHQVTFFGTDDCDNMDTLVVNIFVLDTIPPTIVCIDSTINCGDPIPVVGIGGSDNCRLDVIRLISDTTIIDDCGTGEIIRVYRAFDVSGNTSECTQTIRINGSGLFTENEINWPPSPVEFNDCNDPSTIVVPGTTVDTAGVPCIDVYVFSADSIGSNNDYCYIIYRTWTVIDSCNFDEATGAGKWDSVQIIAINDTTAPVLSGPVDITVAADPVTCSAMVELDSVLASDCDPNVTITNNKGGGPKFVGEVALGTDTIKFTAVDSCGNMSMYMVMITVKDSTPPVITCPDDITIACDSPVVAVVPVVDDACSRWTLSYDSTIIVADCGRDTIIYTFTAIDDCGNTDSCTYRAIVQPSEPFNCELVSLSMDTIRLDTCTADLDPDDLPGSRPEIRETGSCYGLKVFHTDETVSNGGGGRCELEIIRTWNVVDTCDPGFDTCKVIQIILIEDNDPPVLVTPEDLCIFAPDTANGFVIVTVPEVTAIDCDPNVVITNDYNNQGASITDTFRLGQTFIQYIGTDACGNMDTAEVMVEVKDTTPPVFACQKIFRHVTNTNPPIATVKPYEFIVSASDNFTDSLDLWYSFSTDVNDTVRIFGCDTLGVLVVDVYVTDSSGNQDTCAALIRVLDTMMFCPPAPILAQVGGHVQTENGKMVEDVQIIIDGPVKKEDMTNQRGEFMLAGIITGNSYTLTAKKDLNLLNGVSTLDLVMLKKHVLNLDQLDSPYQMIAGDINRSGYISTLDLVELQKAILGISDHFENNTSWRFVDADYTFSNTIDALKSDFPESIRLESLMEPSMTNDLIAIKIGDLNGNAFPNRIRGDIEVRSDQSIQLKIENQLFVADQEIRIPVRINQKQILNGWQFGIAFNPKQLKWDHIEYSGYEPKGFMAHEKDGKVLVSWYSGTEYEYNEEEVLFTMVYRSVKAGEHKYALKFEEEDIRGEAYVNLESLPIHLQFTDKLGNESFELYQNTPNPFTQSTRIQFYTPVAKDISLEIFDATGKTIRYIEGNYPRGYHSVPFDVEGNKVSGVLYYRMKADHFTATRKMLLIQ